MNVEFLIQLCEKHGIKLTLSTDGSDRLLVDAPKGALTPSLREALTAHKLELITALKTQKRTQSSTHDESQTETTVKTNLSSQTEVELPKMPSSSGVSRPPETCRVISEPQILPTFERADVEVKNLLAGRSYEVQVIEAPDAATRQIIATELLSALSEKHTDQHERARQAFLDHGYFDEATRDLRTADSPAERAAAARKLGLVGSRLATTHVNAALFDTAPEVRRAAVEALGQFGDPSAVAPLNELLARETSRQVPESLVRQAINSITPVDTVTPSVVPTKLTSGPELSPNSFAGGALPAPSIAISYSDLMQPSHEDLASEEARLRVEEEALRRAVQEL